MNYFEVVSESVQALDSLADIFDADVFGLLSASLSQELVGL